MKFTLQLLSISIYMFCSIVFANNTDSLQSGSFQNYEDLYGQLRRLSGKITNLAASVSDYTFTRDHAQFNLIEGEFYILDQINNQPAAMIFSGKGELIYAPSIKSEAEQLYRFFGTDTVRTGFDNLFLIFTDSSFKEFSRTLSFKSISQVPRSALADVSKGLANVSTGLEYLCNDDYQYFNPHILKAFFDKSESDLFFAHSNTKEYGSLFFMINPYVYEEVRFMRRAETVHYVSNMEIVCQYSLNSSNANKGDYKLLDISEYNLQCKIEDNDALDFSAACRLKFQPLLPDQNWIYFTIYGELEVDSIKWSNGEPAHYFKGEENPYIWVRCDTALITGQDYTLDLYYQGELIHHGMEGDIYIKSSRGWYPDHGSRNMAVFDIRFQTPEKYPHFCSVGERLSFDKDEDYIFSHWRTAKPIRNASFNFGNYENLSLEEPGMPKIEILASKSNRKIEDVGGDVRNSMRLFNELFGEYPVRNFYVTEIPYTHGEAFPGLIHLSASTFLETDSDGFSEVFRAHEVAHQWWGIEVDFDTYHDQWLSEALCTFAGMNYMQVIYHDDDGNEKYSDILDRWKDAIIDNRSYLLGSGQEAGPVWLGYRTQSSQTKGDFDLIVYKKGGWVFHMLRMMCINTKNLADESIFLGILKDFYKNFRGRRASTEDFIKIVSSHLGQDVNWFFRQWIHGTEIPEYTFSYDVQKDPSGRFTIKCKVLQNNVSPDFRMPVLLKLDFGDVGYFIARQMITGPETVFDLAGAPLEPEDIEFNFLNSVLCEVDYD